MKNIKYNLVQLFLILYLLFCVFISKDISNNNFNLYINPIVLLLIAGYTYIYSENHHGRFENLKENQKSILIATLFYIILYFISGLIFGYARTIYSHKFLAILKNIWQIIIPIISIEYIRSFILNDNKKNYLFIILFTIVFMMIEINYFGLFLSLKENEEAFKYISSIILPIIFSNVLYSYLTIKGSYKLVLVYRVIIELIYLLVPIFPDFDWFLTGVVGIMTPGVIYIFMKFYIKNKRERNSKRERKKLRNPIIYIPIIVIIGVFVCFMAGVFIYEPIAILSNSMVPVFEKGDVVIYRKVKTNELKNLKKYNIIVFSREGQMIVHRVIDKYEKNNKYYFVTKGDANNQRDSGLVEEEELIGVYMFEIKYIGYPSVWLNRFFKNEEAKVETK